METSDLVYGVIIAILLVVIWYICVSWPRETFTDKNGKSITDAQLLTILGNGYYYISRLRQDGKYDPAGPNQVDYAILNKLNFANQSILSLARNFPTVPNPSYKAAISDKGLRLDEPFVNMSIYGMQALLAYRNNVPHISGLGMIYNNTSTIGGLYSVVFDALHNKYINTSQLILSSVSIDDLNISGLPY
jgi:4-amino-4-deoxy-L-arabinose transferase-like glycosyltransferase